jgi:hypothetical protein
MTSLLQNDRMIDSNGNGDGVSLNHPEELCRKGVDPEVATLRWSTAESSLFPPVCGDARSLPKLA